jgi:hypothetical protein
MSALLLPKIEIPTEELAFLAGVDLVVVFLIAITFSF